MVRGGAAYRREVSSRPSCSVGPLCGDENAQFLHCPPVAECLECGGCNSIKLCLILNLAAHDSGAVLDRTALDQDLTPTA